ncbi:hypothetical protein REPUB_Repub20aG0036300 [Reevesia pubescens]
MDSCDHQHIDIAMLPLMGHGHLIPFLALAKQIHNRTGFNITIANIHFNIQYLCLTLQQDPTSEIDLADLKFNSEDHGLPPNTENIENLPLDLIGGAYGTVAYVSLWLNLPHHQTNSEEFSLPRFPESCRFHVYQLHHFLKNADGTDPWSRQHAGKEPGISPKKCLQWLGLNGPDSVLYIFFGSQNTISPSQMMELAIGLEKSWNPFIWVIRPPLGFDLKVEFRPEWLPEGFEDRMAKTKQGLLVKNWAPQLEILSHKST